MKRSQKQKFMDAIRDARSRFRGTLAGPAARVAETAHQRASLVDLPDVSVAEASMEIACYGSQIPTTDRSCCRVDVALRWVAICAAGSAPMINGNLLMMAPKGGAA